MSNGRYHVCWAPALGPNVSSTHGHVEFDTSDVVEGDAEEKLQHATNRAAYWGHASGKPHLVEAGVTSAEKIVNGQSTFRHLIPTDGKVDEETGKTIYHPCLLYTSPSPRD